MLKKSGFKKLKNLQNLQKEEVDVDDEIVIENASEQGINVFLFSL